MLSCGIDPGNEGALALTDGVVIYEICDMPVVVTTGKAKLKFGADGMPVRVASHSTQIDGPTVALILTEWLARHGEFKVVLERVWVLPGQSVSSGAKLVSGAYTILGILIGASVPYDFVEPAKWKLVMGVKADKSTSKDRAAAIFPEWAGDLQKWRADKAEACLLSVYGLNQNS